MIMCIVYFQGDGQKERGIYIKSVVSEGAAAIVSIMCACNIIKNGLET